MRGGERRGVAYFPHVLQKYRFTMFPLKECGSLYKFRFSAPVMLTFDSSIIKFVANAIHSAISPILFLQNGVRGDVGGQANQIH